jgi:hypothetical protein
MTPVQKIKHMILVRLAQFQKQPAPDVTAENVDELYDEAEENDDGNFQDAKEEVRGSGEETGLRCEYSRHYESDAVAAKAPDGSWVGWTYFYGGGKHGEPMEMDWMDDAYSVTVTEEQKMVTVRTFANA